MPTIADIRTRAVLRIKDAAQSLDVSPATDAIDAAIVSAIEEYGKVRPSVAAAVVAGTGAFKYSLTASTPVLAGFDARLSVITSIVYPYDATAQDIQKLEDDDWNLVRLADGLWLWFSDVVPASGQSFLAEYTKPHTCSASALTVEASDYEAVADLSASLALLVLANNYVQSIDGSIAADAVNRQSKASEYRSMASAYRKAYELKMSSGSATGPAMAIAEMDRSDSAGADYHFHGRRRF